MRKHDFGGSWTDDKLERVRKYLVAYTTIFTKNLAASRLTTYYVDAFAGTGYRSKPDQKGPQNTLFPELAETDAQNLMKGSARIALEVDPPFKRYLFIEQKPKYVHELENLKNEFPDKADRVEIVCAEANDYLKKWCKGLDWRHTRAVVFLDPYGMQVDWSLIEALAKTEAIDLWLLFPLGAISRLLTKGKPPPEEWADSLTRIFGSADWERSFYAHKKQPTLFGDEFISDKSASFDSIAQFFVARLKTVFTAVAEKPLQLMNSKNVPLYLLCFAVGNPKGAPTALNIANYILKA